MRSVLVLLFALCAHGADEGSECTVEGARGVCVAFSACPAAIQGVKTGKLPQNCGFASSGEPVVCCPAPAATTTPRPAPLTTARPAATTTEYVPPVYDYVSVGDKTAGGCEPIPPALTAPRTGRKAWDKCVEYQEALVFPCNKSQALSGGLTRTNRCHHNADELIIGGTDAAQHEFPHMALLGFGDDPAALEWSCGGALVSERFVLTAGHCIASRSNGAVSHVALGALRRSENGARYRVRTIHRHPQYAPPHKYHDIALLELDRPVPLDEFTVPACLYTGAAADEARASATGWGLTQYNTQRTADVLQKVILTKFGMLECAVKFPPSRLLERGFDHDTQLCYGDRSLSKDTCQGDSGGPLQVKHKQIACMYLVLGVTSFGRACGVVGQPGIYTRVLHYLPWIESVVWP